MEGADTRFDGLVRLYGPAGGARLAQAHVCIVGLGGVGSWAAEALARSGVGALTLVDPDEVCVSNINRQLLATDAAVGRPKTEVMAERIRAIHPGCRLTLKPRFFREDTAEEILAERYDHVLDAIDGVMPKAGLIAGCVRRGLPVVTCGGSGGKKDPDQIRVADLAVTRGDPLLVFVRKKLRKVFGFPPPGAPFGVPCVFSPEPVTWPEDCGAAPAADDLFGPPRANCEGGIGAAAFVTGAFGLRAAAHVANALARSVAG